jgi:dolichol-phosphate mannosyltransferase
MGSRIDSAHSRARAGVIVKVTILAPAYNEEAVIDRFVSEVSGHLQDGWEILVVDDGSTDSTAAHLERLRYTHPNLRVFTHPVNMGIGRALASGFSDIAEGIIVTIDADLSHPLDLLQPLVDGCGAADACYGSRFVRGGGMVGVPIWRRGISKIANVVLRVAYRSPTRDLTTGYRAYRAEAVRSLDLIGTGFETQLEITIRLLADGRTIDEIPLVLQNRVAGESKMKYLRLIPAYASMATRLLGLRWTRRSEGTD